ncbi:unnamed protein product [Onchocerca flexuosa]|uniref:Atherin-like n=1 Tax=Onchocerca flexuosa TaxID=387005 RepID=A0A183HQR3_9BILA|nr:unnamed protein product [Onchocerca flexuosa]
MVAPVHLVTRPPLSPSTVVVMTSPTPAPAPAPAPIMLVAAPAAPAPAPAAPAAAAPAPAAQPAQPAAAMQIPGNGRGKRSANLIKMKKCRSAEFDVIMDHEYISQETSEIVEKLELKVRIVQLSLISIAFGKVSPTLCFGKEAQINYTRVKS